MSYDHRTTLACLCATLAEAQALRRQAAQLLEASRQLRAELTDFAIFDLGEHLPRDWI